jgi:hypothetical protein
VLPMMQRDAAAAMNQLLGTQSGEQHRAQVR